MRGSRILFTGYYSTTTSKQMTWWLAEYGERLNGLTKGTLKIMWEEGLAYDYKTGELTPLTDFEMREIKHIRHAAFNCCYGW